MNLGFIGTGTMGNPMVRCLIDAGHRLTVHDVRREATTNLCEMGATWAESAREVGLASQAVFTSLPSPAEMETTVLDPDNGILAGLLTGGAYIDLTTNAPDVVRRIAEVCLSRGIEMLDAPVSGRPPRMTVMAGGDAATFEKYRPVFENMAGNVFHMGESGTGSATKLVTQYLGYSNFITALEGLLIGVKAGVDIGLLAQVVPVSAGASRVFDNIPRAVLTGEFTSGGSLDIVAKDLRLACELAREVQAPARSGIIADDAFHRAQVLGWGQDGYPKVAKILEEMAGAELRGDAPEAPSYQQIDPRRD